MGNTLLLGISTADITPKNPIPLSGFSFRKGNVESVRGPLNLRCFIFRRPGEDIVVFSADLLCWGRDTVANCLELLKQKYPLASKSRFLFLATHTHCGPSVTFYFAGEVGGADREYAALVEEKVLETALAASGNFHPVQGFLYTGKTGIPINRRLKTEQGFAMAPNPEGPKNDDIKLLEFTAAEDDGQYKKGEPLGVWACASCHPTASGDNRVDREFFVRGLDYYLKSRSPKAVGAYIQGCCGDVRPPLIDKDGAFYRGSLDLESEELARRFAEELEAARKGGGLPLSFDDPMTFRRMTAMLPFNPDFPHKDRHTFAPLDNETGEWARHFADTPVPPAMPLDLTFFKLSRELSFLFLSAEVVSEYSLYCREISGDRVWAGAYAGGMTTYIPTAAQLTEGGYEPYDCMFYLFQPAPFAAEAEGILKNGIRTIISQE
jgi:hypothetical protein